MKKLFLSLSLASLSALSAHGSTSLTEDFAADPLLNGWQVFGDTNLFRWDATNQNLAVTWDSSQSNSYFHQPLGLTATKSDNFSIGFDVRLDDIGPGSDTNKQYSFNLSIGLLNHGAATRPEFLRGTGYSSPDLAEFAYFWDSGYGATAWPVLVDSFSSFNFSSTNDYAIFALTSGDWYRVVMTYTAAKQTLLTTITNLTHNTGIRITAVLDSYFTDFAVDAISISSYNDTDGYEGSVLAHGAVDNLTVTVTRPPIKNMTGAFSNGVWQVQFISQSNWSVHSRTFDEFSFVGRRVGTHQWQRHQSGFGGYQRPAGPGFLPRARPQAMNRVTTLSPLDSTRCPLCGGRNDCQLCAPATDQGPCWCAQVEMPAGLLAQVPPDRRNAACICRACVIEFQRHERRAETQSMLAGDCYFDSGGLMVFTAAYHRRRGYCCGSGCRHCPYPGTKSGRADRTLAIPSVPSP